MAGLGKTLGGAVLILGIGAATIYYVQFGDSAGATPAQGPGRGGPQRALPVLVAQAEVGAQPIEISAIGSVQASETVQVRSRVDGTILEVHFKEGDRVNEGDLLFTIDPRGIQADLKQAEANLARNKVAMGNSNRDLDRQNALAAKNFASQAALDSAKSTAGQAMQTVRAMEAQIEALKVQLGYTQIRAPISGRTGQILQTKGNIVRSGEATGLVTIRKVNPIAVTFSVPQRHFPDLRAALDAGAVPVRATVAGQPAQTGKVAFFDNQIDSATGTFSVKAQFDNEGDVLWPGMFVSVTARLGTEAQAVSVPTAAIQTGQQGQYLFAVEEKDGAKAVKMTPVTTSRQQGDRTILASGLKGGETVVIDGQLRLVDNSRIEVRDPAAASGAAPARQNQAQKRAPQG
ncbi:efflux RND transporter periplasmic adaptor subunit [Lacibacterium aquatile]|uniref:Efflux RND transporter periplasmic adaptor subunit n=1 Tax=Lacibacterium aquatile TaxID=1168082 RepID=A0ABW5DXZ8_9PROT